MTEKEYYYNVELLKLLEDMIKKPNILGEHYFTVYIHYLRERLDSMFDGEREETQE